MVDPGFSGGQNDFIKFSEKGMKLRKFRAKSKVCVVLKRQKGVQFFKNPVHTADSLMQNRHLTG